MGAGQVSERTPHRGKTTGHTQPTTSMTITLALCHPLFALAANVKGMRINETAAESNSKPMTSISYHIFLVPPRNVWPCQGLCRRKCSLAAFLMSRNRVRANSKKTTGRTMVHIPYPHLHVVCSIRLLAIGAPTHTVIKKGMSGRLETNALLRSPVSAI